MVRTKKYTTVPFTVRFNGKGKPKIDTPYEEVVKLTKTQKFFWHNVNYQSTESAQSLCRSYGIDEDSIEALTETDTRPRYFTTTDGIVFILRAVNSDPQEEDNMISVRFWVDKEKIISLSGRRIASIDAVLSKIEDGTLAVANPMECFLEIADQITADIVDAISDLSDEADDLETEVISAHSERDAELRAEVSRQRRTVVSIRRYLVPMQNIYITIKNEKIDWLNDDNKRDIRELYNNITKAIEDLDYVRDHLLVSFEELQSKVNVRISHIMYFFSVVTVIFLPLTFVTGLLGINVEGIPFSDSKYAFATVSSILVLSGLLLIWILKKKKWI